jgi:hypothetical protein
LASLADLIRSMAAAGAPPEAIAIAVDAIESASAADAQRRAKQAERKARSRAKSPCHGTVTVQSRDMGVTVTPALPLNDGIPSSSLTEGNLNPNPAPPIVPPAPKSRPKPTDDQRQRFWAAYPSRGEGSNPKKPAIEAFDRAIGRGFDPEMIIAAAKRYRSTFEGPSTFVMQAIRWLNNECWEQYAPRQAQAAAVAEPKPREDPSTWDRARWLRELNYARQSSWQSRMGPMPGSPGCLAPPDLINPGEVFRKSMFMAA